MWLVRPEIRAAKRSVSHVSSCLQIREAILAGVNDGVLTLTDERSSFGRQNAYEPLPDLVSLFTEADLKTAVVDSFACPVLLFKHSSVCRRSERP
jgi:hypothetical protein